jgi:signal transduction histidine kinase
MTLSLRTMLALGLVVTVAVPAAAGAGTWLTVGDWQARRERAHEAAALHAVASVGAVDSAAQRGTLARNLGRLGVEAELSRAEPFDTIALDQLKAATAVTPADPGLPAGTAKVRDSPADLRTPGLDAILQRPGGKQRLATDFTGIGVKLPRVAGTLFVPHESVAVRWAITVGAAAAGLALAIALAVGLLNRWILRPLARLAGDADRIAGGEPALGDPPRTPTREVAQVGEALHGMADALGSALGASAEAERERRFLVSAIAHDLRTPLFTLRGSLEAIERGLGNGDALARAQRKAALLDRLVGDLFAFSRAEYAEPAAERVDLAVLARRAADTVEPGAVRLAVEGEGTADADAVALQRVLTNLVENAVRHARSRVTVTVDGASVAVADDGPGFAPADLPHVFEPLFRGDRARAPGGAGLGLAIARRLVEAHGGTVQAANAPEGGARVTVRLPGDLVKPHQPAQDSGPPRSSVQGGWSASCTATTRPRSAP